LLTLKVAIFMRRATLFPAVLSFGIEPCGQAPRTLYANHTPNEVSMKTLLMIVAALTIPMSAQAATMHHSATHKARASQAQIACTDVGCLPVPGGCFPTGGKTFNGSPTGFDVMVCPDGTRYGHL
jgi:hypothetical protein